MVLPAKSFYKLNFGFMPAYKGEEIWTRKYESVGVSDLAAAILNEVILECRPYFKSNLSSLYVNSIYHRAKQYHHTDRFQWIVYDSDSYLSNLPYFWNRQLYMKPENRLLQVVAPVTEMEQLLESPGFEKLLYYLNYTKPTYLVSPGTSSLQVDTLREKMQANCQQTRILSDNVARVPFETNGYNFLRSSLMKPSQNLIIGKSDYLRHIRPAFEILRVMKYGHDEFLLEFEAITKVVGEFVGYAKSGLDLGRGFGGLPD